MQAAVSLDRQTLWLLLSKHRDTALAPPYRDMARTAVGCDTSLASP